MHVRAISMDVSHVTLTQWDFFSPSVSVWPILAFGHIQLFRFLNICVVVGDMRISVARDLPTGTADMTLDPASVCPLPVVCLHQCQPQPFSPLWKLDPKKAKQNAAYVHCETLWICPSTSLRWHHDSSHSLLNLPNNYSHFLLDQTLMKHLTWTSESLHYLCGSLQSGKQREVGESVFFQVVCVSRWDGITAQNQGPTGECGVWGTYGQTGCWWAAYTSFS